MKMTGDKHDRLMNDVWYYYMTDMMILHHITDITQWLTWLITSKFETFNIDLMIDFTITVELKLNISHFHIMWRLRGRFCSLLSSEFPFL